MNSYDKSAIAEYRRQLEAMRQHKRAQRQAKNRATRKAQQSYNWRTAGANPYATQDSYEEIDLQTIYKDSYDYGGFDMKAVRVGAKVQKKILWTSDDGVFVVVEAPFPDGFVRCETRRTVLAAAALSTYDTAGMMTRGPASQGYAKCMASAISATHNEHGEISP